MAPRAQGNTNEENAHMQTKHKQIKEKYLQQLDDTNALQHRHHNRSDRHAATRRTARNGSVQGIQKSDGRLQLELNLPTQLQ